MANTKVKAEQLEAAQTNITSVGTLSALTISGDLTVDTSTLKVDSSNNRVGIIDTTPAEALSVTGAILAEGNHATATNAMGATAGILLHTSSPTAYVTATSSGSNNRYLQLRALNAGSANQNQLVLSYVDKQIGIGTDAPDVNSFGAGHGVLTVQSATGSAKTAMLNLSGDGNDTDATRVASLFFNDASATGAGKSLAGIEAYRASNHATDPGGNLLFSTNASGGSYTERMRIRASGGVGIGTAGYDGQILAVNAGTGDTVLYGESTDANCFASFRDNSSTANISYGAIGNNHVFRADQTERMRIDSSGRLLIGTTSHASGYSTPGGNSGENAHYSKLWVQGNTYATTGDGRITLSSGTSWPANNTAIGQIFFSTAWGGDHAAISCYTGGAVGNTDYPGELRFYTTQDGTSTLAQAMSIRQHGTVHVGPSAVTTDSNYAALVVKDNNVNRSADSTFYVDSGGTADWTARIGGSYEYALRVDTTSSASYAIGAVADSSSWKFRVQGNGSIYAVNTDISSISDRRLKENITDAKSQWDDIKALKWKNFNWTKESGHDDGKTKLGLIADEVEKISPNLIQIDAQSKEDKDAGKEDPEYKTVKYSIVWVKAMKALQEAMERIETLESEVKTLKGG